MTQYRKKPVVIDAFQWDGTIYQADQLMQWMKQSNTVATYCASEEKSLGGYEPPYLIIPTLEGQHIASVGDFIIRGVKGEFYPCKPDIFEMSYERVP